MIYPARVDSSHLKKIFVLEGSLYCYVSVYCIAKWISHTYAYIP